MEAQGPSLEKVVTPSKSKRRKKRRAQSDPDTPIKVHTGNDKAEDGAVVNDPNEPTLGEKLASLDLLIDNKPESIDKEEEAPSLDIKPPSADSVHVLLKQSLNADDRSVLLNCLYNQDEKVISKSISLLNQADVFKLLQSLIYITESRGAILACALPWLRILLLQHATSIMSRESSLIALNSLYQLIESRVSTFDSALELSNSLEFLFTGVQDEEDEDEKGEVIPVIYEDKDGSDDEDESKDEMETDEEDDNKEEEEEKANGGLMITTDVEE